MVSKSSIDQTTPIYHSASAGTMENAIDSRSCFCKKYSVKLHALRLPWFLSFRLRTFQLHSQFETKRRFCLETEIGPEFQYCNDLHDDKRERSRLGQFSVSYKSSLLLAMSDRYEAAYILCTNVPFARSF